MDGSCALLLPERKMDFIYCFCITDAADQRKWHCIVGHNWLMDIIWKCVFEKGDYQSFFGLSKTDAIEFIIYDVNNNQLPQQSANNQLVRYVPLTNTNIKDYFLIASNTVLQKNKLPAEYFIDAERLIKEAGYNNGIFKTQITLVNHRAGSNKPYDKLYSNAKYSKSNKGWILQS